jgi:hypothetical protein
MIRHQITINYILSYDNLKQESRQYPLKTLLINQKLKIDLIHISAEPHLFDPRLKLVHYGLLDLSHFCAAPSARLSHGYTLTVIPP